MRCHCGAIFGVDYPVRAPSLLVLFPLAKIRFGDRTITLPASRALRICIGVGLILAGFVGFLPILGFWMVPLGLVVLSVDIPVVRRWRRRSAVAITRWWQDARDRPLFRWLRGLRSSNP